MPVNHSTPFGVFHLLTYETMIDNLLTMSEIIQMVTDVRTKDAGIIQKMAEIMTAYAEYEKNRLPPVPQRRKGRCGQLRPPGGRVLLGLKNCPP